MSVTIDATGLKAWVVSIPNQHHARTPDRTAGTIVRLKDQKCEVMNRKELLTPAITVKEVLDRYPQVLQVFMDIGLLCIGFPAEAFHTLEDVALEHNIDLNQYLQRIYSAIEDDIVQLGLSSQKRDVQNGI